MKKMKLEESMRVRKQEANIGEERESERKERERERERERKGEEEKKRRQSIKGVERDQGGGSD